MKLVWGKYNRPQEFHCIYWRRNHSVKSLLPWQAYRKSKSEIVCFLCFLFFKLNLHMANRSSFIQILSESPWAYSHWAGINAASFNSIHGRRLREAKLAHWNDTEMCWYYCNAHVMTAISLCLPRSSRSFNIKNNIAPTVCGKLIKLKSNNIIHGWIQLE